MTWQEQGGISEIFWTSDRKFAIQRVDRFWRLYGGEMGYFIREFGSFPKVQEYIRDERMNERTKGEKNDD